MAYIKALCCLQIRLPTLQELHSLPIHDLTSDEFWSPQFGESDPYDGFMETVDPSTSVTLMPVTSTQKDFDWEFAQKCFGWKPIDTIITTFQNTTQFATNHIRLPMREHFKTRFPSLNVRRIHEVVATDTFFASTTALGGETCAQLYTGKTS